VGGCLNQALYAKAVGPLFATKGGWGSMIIVYCKMVWDPSAPAGGRGFLFSLIIPYML